MQSISISSRSTVVQPCGHINAANASTLRRQLAETVSSHEFSSLLVDMSRVESLDSAGLMALVSTLTLAQQLNKHFGLCSISPSIRIIFELTQLDRVFEISDQRPTFEAVAA